MKKIYIFTLMLFPMLAFSQLGGEDEVYLSGDRIEAKFNGGGIDKFQEFVNKHFDRTKVTKPGKMVAQFTIDTDGKMQNIKLIEMIDSESAMEMIRVLNLSPAWTPAKRGGKAISIEIEYPMVFRTKNKSQK